MSRTIEDYSYDLPTGNIAQKPLPRRDGSRLLVYDRGRGTVADDRFSRIGNYLEKGDLLVLNDSAVMPARLVGRKTATGGRIEVLMLRKVGPGRWQALLRGKAAVGAELDFGARGVDTTVESVTGDGEVVLRFSPPGSGVHLMEKKGLPPLPPYIRRGEKTSSALKASDRRRYQTLFAVRRGSAAAPTAGLHFTERLFQRLRRKGVDLAFVTLHVGPATFRPLRVDRIEDAAVQGERGHVPAATARAVGRTRRRGGRIVAVGTTVARTLEHFADGDGRLGSGWREVDLTIRPGHDFRVVEGLVTNFHLPRSSLLLLVSALAGRERILELYGGALKKGYRFYSYGDAMLIL